MKLFRCLFVLVIMLSGPAWGLETEDNIDPWESINRRIFTFNETADKYLLLPAAKGYRRVVPDPAERGVNNFITNIYEFNSVFNSLLQGRPENALKSAGRLLLNTGLGLGGLFDVATPMGIEHTPADFGQTLSVWGVESGPYVMLPIWGPRTARSATGYFVDTYTSAPNFLPERNWAYLFWVVEAIDIRANLINADNLITGDRYIFVRNAYLQRREYFLNDGVVTDSFSEFELGDEYEEF